MNLTSLNLSQPLMENPGTPGIPPNTTITSEWVDVSSLYSLIATISQTNTGGTLYIDQSNNKSAYTSTSVAYMSVEQLVTSVTAQYARIKVVTGSGYTTSGFATLGGTAATETAIVDVGGQEFNVKAYGAKGDGVTDDSAAILAANAAATAKGGIVFYPPGTYVKTQPVSVSSGVTHVGCGKGVTIILGGVSSGADYSFIGASGALVTNAGIKDLTLNSQNVSNASCINMYYFENLLFLGVEFLNTGFKFVQNNVSTESTIDNTNLLFRDCDFNGSSASSTTEGLTFANTNLVAMEDCSVTMSPNTARSVLYYQLCTNTSAKNCTFSTSVLTSISCNTQIFDSCRFNGPNGGLSTNGVSDHGTFGYTLVEGVITSKCTFTDVLNLGSSRGYRDLGSTFANNSSIAVQFYPQSGQALGFDFRFTNSVFRDNNQGGGNNPIIYLPGVASDLGLYLDGCIFDDDQATPTQKGVFQQPQDIALSGVTATNCKFSGGSTKAFFEGGYSSIGLNVLFKNNDGYNPTGPQTAPAVPASGTALTNPFPFNCTVYVAGGVVTAIAVGGTATGLTSGSVFIPTGETITLTYTSVPTWVWIGD